jgi:hypothetical protein
LTLGIFTGTVADGQTWSSNPRFRGARSGPSPTQVIPSLMQPKQKRRAVRRVSAESRQNLSASGEIRGAHGERADAAAADRARQALWHAQSNKERQSVPQAIGYRPKHLRLATAELPSEVAAGENIVAQQPWSEDMQYHQWERIADDEAVWEDNMGCADGSCGCVDGSCGGAAGSCGCDYGCFDCYTSLPPAAVYAMGDFTIFGGVQGFKNGINQGRSGSFGFHEGFNFGTALPLFPYSGIGWQFGLRATQSNLSGTAQTRRERHQTFITTGLFRRRDWGLQFGVVVDVLDDDWVDDYRLTQLRGQIGWNFGNQHEWGYWFAASDDKDQTAQELDGGLNLHVIDVQGCFYRRHLACCPGGTARLFVGFSNDTDGIIAASSNLPLSHRFTLQSAATYLVPSEPSNAGGAENEIWNLSMSLVFSFRGAGADCEAPFAPMFRVADNGVFFVDADGLSDSL